MFLTDGEIYHLPPASPLNKENVQKKKSTNSPFLIHLVYKKNIPCTVMSQGLTQYGIVAKADV